MRRLDRPVSALVRWFRLFALLGMVGLGGLTAEAAPEAAIKAEPAQVQTPAKGAHEHAQERVIVYSTTWCGYCKAVRAHLRQMKIPYTDFNISRSATARARFEALGGQGVPLVFVGTRRMDGYDELRLNQMLRAGGY